MTATAERTAGEPRTAAAPELTSTWGAAADQRAAATPARVATRPVDHAAVSTEVLSAVPHALAVALTPAVSRAWHRLVRRLRWATLFAAGAAGFYGVWRYRQRKRLQVRGGPAAAAEAGTPMDAPAGPVVIATGRADPPGELGSRLLRRHEDIEDVLRQLSSLPPGASRQIVLNELASALGRHEAIEQMCLYQAARENGGAALVGQQIDQNAHIIESLRVLESADSESERFAGLFEEFEALVVAHLEFVGQQVVPLLESALPADACSSIVAAVDRVPLRPAPRGVDADSSHPDIYAAAYARAERELTRGD